MLARHTYIWVMSIPDWGITKYKEPKVGTLLLHVPWTSSSQFSVARADWAREKMDRSIVRERAGKSDYLGICGQL